MSESPVGTIRQSKAVGQLKKVCELIPSRPISVWDSEYGCAPFVLKTAEIAADILVRLRSNLCLWGIPPAYLGSGRPRKHGAKFKLNEPSTWGEVGSVLEVNDPKLGRVKVSLWEDLHFRKAANRSMSLLRVERLDEHGNLRVKKPLWLARDIVADNPLPWQKSMDKLTLLSSCSSDGWSFRGEEVPRPLHPNLAENPKDGHQVNPVFVKSDILLLKRLLLNHVKNNKNLLNLKSLYL